jgi:hypothetical protein
VQGVNTVGMTRQGFDLTDAESLEARYAAAGAGAGGAGAGPALTDWAAPDALRPAVQWWLARTSVA